MTILGQALFGVMLGLGAGAYVVVSDYRARYVYMEDVAGAMAASLMPMVIDRDIPAVQGQLGILQSLAGRGDIVGIEFSDTSGRVLATIGDLHTVDTSPASTPIIDRLFGPHSIRHHIAIGDVHYGSVRLAFGERSLIETLGAAMVVALLVTLSVVLVSALWFSWLTVRTVIEPIQAIQTAARRLADGKRDIFLGLKRNDEIGLLGDSIENLAQQLQKGEAELRDALRDARKAQIGEARLRKKTEEEAQLKSDFVAVIAHELGTPLSVVTLYSDVLVSSREREADEDSAEVIDGIAAAASRLNSIVNDLLDTALLDRGVMRITMKPVDLAEVVREAAKDAARLSDTHDLRVDLGAPDRPDRPLLVHADRVRIRQILDNLLSNATKYSPTGSTVTVRAFRDNDDAVIQVEDQGPGIPHASRSRVFQMFGRLDHSDNRDTAGLGLGLAISARIAQAHSGTLGFEAGNGGVGTVFTLSIPLLSTDEINPQGHGPSTVKIIKEAEV